MKNPIEVNLYYGVNNCIAEDDSVKVEIRGMKQMNDGVIRILNLPEKLDNVAIYYELTEIGSPATSKIYEEKFV